MIISFHHIKHVYLFMFDRCQVDKYILCLYVELKNSWWLFFWRITFYSLSSSYPMSQDIFFILVLTFILSFVCQSSTNSYQFPIVQLYTYQQRKEIVRVLYSIVKKKKKVSCHIKKIDWFPHMSCHLVPAVNQWIKDVSIEENKIMMLDEYVVYHQ